MRKVKLIVHEISQDNRKREGVFAEAITHIYKPATTGNTVVVSYVYTTLATQKA